jgi:serine-type D-Ala-D-Ala carboxypeptidase
MVSAKTRFQASDVGFDPARLEAVDRHFLRLISERQIHGAIYCLSRDGKIFAERAHGKLSFRAEDPRELTPDSVYGIASITKLFTACAIFRLVEDGKLRLNQGAGEILPEMAVAPYSAITLAQLLSHTSGLHPDPGCFENKYHRSPWDFIGARKEGNWLEAGLSVGLRTKPGTEWAYCSFGFCILGEVVTRVSGVNVHDFIRREIIEPCGLPDSAFGRRKPSTAAETERLLGLLRRCAVLDEESERGISDALAGKERPPSPFDDVPDTGGGIISTTRDVNRFGNMLMNSGSLDGKRILGRRTVIRMTETYTGPEIRDYCWGALGVHRPYALGPDRRRTADNLYSAGYFFHEGSGGCALIIDPEERMVASWFVPYVDDVWRSEAIYNTGAVIWSGLE